MKTFSQLAALSLLFIGLIAVPADLSAQKKKKKGKVEATEVATTPAKEEAPDAVPVITDECIMNISLFNESAKNKQFADAVGPWYEVFNTCPNAHMAIYQQGPKIVAWQIQNAATPEEKEQHKATLMKIYDERIKWFGNDKRYPKAYILGEKATDYCEFFPEDKLKLKAYDWLKESVNGMGDKSKVATLRLFADITYALYKSDTEKYGEQYINDYQLVSSILGTMAANTANKNAASAQAQKDYIDGVFAASGAADCAKLEELYAQTVQDNLTNIEMLDKIMKLFRRVKCTESAVYFAAAEASHKLQPTAESAAGCAAMSAKKGDYEAAIAYYDEAFNLSTDDQDRADYLYNNAVYYYQNLRKFQTARQYAYRSLETVPNQGRCYMLIGLMYAESKPYDNDVLNKTVFWVAVDKFIKARNVDPTCEEDAKKLIANYSRYFPTTEEVFFQPELGEGQKFTVAGWIGETTTCRASD